jgi:hypothetical protein
MRTQRVRALAAIGVACVVTAAAQAAPAVADTPGDLISQPCRTPRGAPPDWELQRLSHWMGSTASAGPNPQFRVGAFEIVLRELGGQAGAVGLDNARGTFYVRFGPGPLDAAAVHDRFVRAVERSVPAEHVEAIRPRLRVVAQTYPQAELMDLQRSFFDRLRAERPDVPVSGGVGCWESDDVRLELAVYDTPGNEGEAAVRRMAAEYGDRILVYRREGGPPTPGIGRLPAPPGRPPLPTPPPPPAAPVLSPLPRFAEAVVVRRRCGRRPTARIALTPAWSSRLRAFRVGTGRWRRTAVVVPLRRTVRVEVTGTDGRSVAGRIARCN